MTIYKICSQLEWQEACDAGFYTGSRDDKRDGFIHFSTRDQVTGTLVKHFSGKSDLLLLAIDVSLLKSQDLKYEGSVGGKKYPHLYGTLCPSAVKEHYIISQNEAGEHMVDF